MTPVRTFGLLYIAILDMQKHKRLYNLYNLKEVTVAAVAEASQWREATRIDLMDSSSFTDVIWPIW